MAAPSSPDPSCTDGGMLAGMDIWFPEVPSARFVSDQELVACNRLFCQSCRSWIRSLDACALSQPTPIGDEIEQLFIDPRAERSARVTAALGSRTYVCRCTCVDASKRRAARDAHRGWCCGGHPGAATDDALPSPPVASDTELEKMLRQSADGPPAFGDDYPWHFAMRWRPAFVFDHVWPVVSALLTDGDPTVRRRALEIVFAWKPGSAVALGRLRDIATNHAELYQDSTLKTELCGALASKAVDLPLQGPLVAKLIVGLLNGEPPRDGAETVVAQFEPNAVIQSASRWTEDASDRSCASAAARAMAIYRRDHLLGFLRRLAGWSEANREQILKPLPNALAIPDETLRVILDKVGVPLPATQPTADECRHALGLP
ncbi:MAG TPA: hypothetical protein VMZ53_11405 [Kofleriaceae bacterium]|nr:hypothetical protein [Kofleriaceae bacterium]